MLERLSPVLAQVDRSSGSIGIAVSNAIMERVPIRASAPTDATMREAWLERLAEGNRLRVGGSPRRHPGARAMSVPREFQPQAECSCDLSLKRRVREGA